jgi:hypothetical protein
MDISTVVDHLREKEHTSLENGVTSGQLAEEMGVETSTASWALAQQFNKKKGTVLRRRKLPPGEGRGWTYWLGTRNASGTKGPRRTTKKHVPKEQANGIGIYFCRETGDDVVLTFAEAEELFKKLRVVFE